PGVVDPAACEAVAGRVFPEASVLSTPPGQLPAQDFVSFSEFQAGLSYLAGKYPDTITVHEVAQSAGLCVGGIAQQCLRRDRLPVYMVEITDKRSPVPLENRQALLFMLSIHGVEKGGREGGFRVIEDLAKGIGFAAEGVQNGAGLPSPIAKPTGGEVATYADYLAFQRLFLLFPNPDGWAHDELPYAATTQPSCGQAPNGVLFCRSNGNGTDLNRQAPTLGWQNPNRHVVGEPEPIGYYNWMLEQGIRWTYAIDIHGMLNHQNFVAIMLPAGSMTPQEMQRSVRLAETLKERLNGNEHFQEWQTLFATAEQGQDLAHPVLQGSGLCGGQRVPLVGSPNACGATREAGSSVFAEYYTVIDAIGYTDSGFNGDYFAQDTGLNAPGYDIELAYNHITVDSAYPGLGALWNDYHVKAVREIVKSYMDAASLDVRISFDTGGKRTLVIPPTFVATNADDESPSPGGWADRNPGDDRWAYSADKVFQARPAKYWEDLKPFVRDGARPGVLALGTVGDLRAARLSAFDTLVIPGSAIRDIESDPAAVAAVRAWVEQGGELVLTDEALRWLDLAGVTEGAVSVQARYMGGIRMDLSHEMLAKVRGGVKQTYEPTPLGYAVGANAAPNWAVDPAALQQLGGEAAGLECGTPNLSDPCAANGVALGRLPLGQGRVQFIGALLPDPTEEFYHPYGLDHYATTYSGNQILRNMLGWQEVYEAPPVVIRDDGTIVETPNEPVAPAEEAPEQPAR
ncbi:MAG TPA: hypothetical protein VFH47_03855, partial [Candidatus Thermoplasmatota archaeon]|nr:hypothetical protein [Candidatus Thermoplasmatota archaeon]